MAKRKKTVEQHYAELMTEAGYTNDLPAPEVLLADTRKNLERETAAIASRPIQELLISGGPNSRIDRKILIAATFGLMRIDIIEQSANPSFVFKATLELGAAIRLIEKLKSTKLQTAKGGKNSGVWMADDRRSKASELYKPLAENRSKHKAIVATRRQLGIEYSCKPPSVTTVRRMLGLDTELSNGKRRTK